MEVILALLGLLIVCITTYGMYSSYSQKQDEEKRRLIRNQKKLVAEADDLLMNSSQLPYSKTLILLLQNRVLCALSLMLEAEPSLNYVRDRINDMRKQMEYIKANYNEGSVSPLKSPSNDVEAISMLKTVRRLRQVVRIEHNKGKIDPNSFAAEDRRLELILIKVNISSLMNHIREAISTHQLGSARQMLETGIQVLAKIQTDDQWIVNTKQQLSSSYEQINQRIEAENERKAELAASSKDELDELFQPKKKW